MAASRKNRSVKQKRKRTNLRGWTILVLTLKERGYRIGSRKEREKNE